MPEQIQNILNRIRDWWQKFTTRQKAIILSSAAVVVIALIILGVVVSRPKWVVLKVADDAETATKVQKLLTDNDIAYRQSSDGFTFSIHEEDTAQATLLLGTNDISSSGFTVDDAVNGSFSTTEADKQKKYKAYLEDRFAKQFESLEGVTEAAVNINLPNDDGTIIASKEEASATVQLKFTEGDFDKKEIAQSIAKAMKTNLRNKSLENISVIDSKGVSLFSGDSETSDIATASSNLEYKAEAEKKTADKVRSTLAHDNGMNISIYDNVDVGVNLTVDFSKEDMTRYKYWVEEGNTQGYLDSHSETNSVVDGGTGGVPGTDSNDDDTTYVMPDYGNTHSETSSINDDYLPNEDIITKTGEVGKIDYSTSTISVVANNYITYNEDRMKKSGELKGTSFEEFRSQNGERTQVEVPEDIINSISKATGIPVANISVLAYDVPMFEASTGGRTLTDYLQIVIALLVLALLGFVVFRSLRSEKEEEVEEEVSVEDLLSEQSEEALEDIGFNEKSEARILIEKFVDENPEAVANLLRNWLNEDWG